MTDEMKSLIEMSNRYGANPDYVLAGGGNTSAKDKKTLWVKASGTKLATIGEDGFVGMDVKGLLAMLKKKYPADDDAREADALADMMAARLPGQQEKRPSVECLLHAILPQNYVLHLHPALVNGLTCGQKGKALCAGLFPEAVWVPLTKPGYVLAKACFDLLEAYQAAAGKPAQMLFMQNHGVMVAADTVEEIDALMDGIMAALQARVTQQPGLEPLPAPGAAETLAPVLRTLYLAREGQGAATFYANASALAFAAGQDAMAPLMMPYIPDQIVYCKGSPLYLADGADVPAAFESFCQKNGYAPKIVVAQNLGFFALGKTRKEAGIAGEVFLDAIKIAVYSQAFGGPLQLDDAFTRFILDWEVESYRRNVALGAAGQKRMEGKLCLVTGAAQGFGEGIARALAAQGGSVVIADMNEEGAGALAGELCDIHGEGTALGVQVNVADEDSVREMIRQTALYYGGLDLLVSCAGILIAGDLTDLTLEQFNKVTAVNYTGYFLCAKYGTAPMKIQRAIKPDYTADIIEVNSKSGLEGSRANFAYAGSKFGGIGLTQSFALELAGHGIKVNAVCPGNLLDGPLWSDPERGLFVQYLRAGKVPGAKTVQDVRAFYEAKVPLGRGCTIEDVARAILYIVEQQYETGQAVPVTGGQVMLR